MKKRDKDEFHGIAVTDIDKKVNDLRKQLKEARLTMQTKEVKNRHSVREMRKKIAVALSIRRVKELTQKKEGKS